MLAVLAVLGAAALYASPPLQEEARAARGCISRSSPLGHDPPRRARGPRSRPGGTAAQDGPARGPERSDKNVAPDRARGIEPRLSSSPSSPKASSRTSPGSWTTAAGDGSERSPRPRPFSSSARSRRASSRPSTASSPLNAYEPVFGAARLEVTPRYILFRQMIRLGLAEGPCPTLRRPGAMDLGRIFEANGSSALIVAPLAEPDPRGDADPRSERAFSQVFKIDGPETGPPARDRPQGLRAGLGPRGGGVRRKGPPGAGLFPSPARRPQHGRGVLLQVQLPRAVRQHRPGGASTATGRSSPATTNTTTRSSASTWPR